MAPGRAQAQDSGLVALDVPEVLLGPDNHALVPEVAPGRAQAQDPCLVALDVPEFLLGPDNHALVPEVVPGRAQAQDPGLGPRQDQVPGRGFQQPEVNPGPRSALVPDQAPLPQRRSQRERKNH